MNIYECSPQLILEDRLAQSFGLPAYIEIQNTVLKVNVATDSEFQTLFNGFYRVRRNQDWRRSFYEIFELSKGKTISFKEVLMSIYESTGNIEPSFTSKLIATLNPYLPIWDQYVLKNVGLRLSASKGQERIAECIDVYGKLINWYDHFLDNEKSKEYIRCFNDALPDYCTVSDTKKIDCFLWGMR